MFFFQIEQLYNFAKANLTEVDVCKIKNDKLNDLLLSDDNNFQVVSLIATETVLSSLIPEKDFTGLLNLIRFLVTKTTVKENKSALVSNKLSAVLKLH